MQNEIKRDKKDYFVNLFLGFLTSVVFVIFAKVFYESRNGADERFFQPFSLNCLGLLILPVIFSFFAKKFGVLEQFWIAIFWLILLVEFIATIAFIFFTAN
jgi:hypothetical protein